MSGRYRALLLAVASSGSLLFAWIGAAVVALVILRKGSREGLWLVLWASLPAFLVTTVSGDSSALAMLLGTAILALVLRASVSLALTAVASAGGCHSHGLRAVGFWSAFAHRTCGLVRAVFCRVRDSDPGSWGRAFRAGAPDADTVGGHDGYGKRWPEFFCVWRLLATGRGLCTIRAALAANLERCNYPRRSFGPW